MPLIQIDMWEGRSRDQKAALVTVFTREMARICGSREQDVTVIIREHGRDNWADAGFLASAEEYPL